MRRSSHTFDFFHFKQFDRSGEPTNGLPPLQNEPPITLYVRLVTFAQSIERPYIEERIMSLEDLAKKAEEGFEKVVDAAKEKAEEAKDKLTGK